MSALRILAALMFVAASTSAEAQIATARATPRAGRITPIAHGDALTTIQGNVLTSTNGRLADAPVRLRDARSGRIVDVQSTDKAGLFSFHSVEPGTYIVEVMAPDESTVLAASDLLTVNAGDTISAILKLPIRVPPFAGVATHAATNGSIAALAAQAASSLAALAASSGIVAVAATASATCPIQ